MQEVNWQTIGAALRAPFDPAVIEYRVQGGKPYAKDGKQYGRVVAYVDARAVADRLDAVVGPGAWAFDWTPLATKDGAVTVVKGTLTIHGVAKSDVGDAGETEPSKAAVSDALKRAAVLWGVGRYLYDLPAQWGVVDVDTNGRITGLARGAANELRAKLPKPTPAKSAA